MNQDFKDKIIAARPTNLGRLVASVVFIIIANLFGLKIFEIISYFHFIVGLSWLYIVERHYTIYESNPRFWYLNALIDIFTLTIFVYLTGTTKSASGFAESITLQPGEYYVYTDKEVANSVVTPIRNINNALSNMKVKVYPNPVKTTSNVEYNLQESGQVSLFLMDISGKKVANLFSGFKPKGNQIFELNRNKIGKVSNGIYLLEIGFNGMKKVEKIIIE
jgi:hypothetical protein